MGKALNWFYDRAERGPGPVLTAAVVTLSFLTCVQLAEGLTRHQDGVLTTPQIEVVQTGIAPDTIYNGALTMKVRME